MQGKIISDLSFCLSENGLSLDELVIKLLEAFERKALVEILRLILMLVQEVLIYRISRNKSEIFTCCASGKLWLNGSYNRCIRTSSREVFLSLWRVQCSVCGKTFVPLKQFVELGHYQTKTNELERTIIEAVAGTNYRRAVANLYSNGKIKISPQTANRWVLATDCDEIQLSKEVIGTVPLQIMPDGTKFKGKDEERKAKKGDLKVVIGIRTNGEVFPLGAWAGSSWDKINAYWKKAEIKMPEGSILISDG
jgi:hypothetical protein